jgi:hypothetical protein
MTQIRRVLLRCLILTLCCPVLLFTPACFSQTVERPQYDILIANGHILDGIGSPLLTRWSCRRIVICQASTL